jgi:hypothetical protein
MSTRKDAHKKLIQAKENLRSASEDLRADIEKDIRDLRQILIKITRENVDFSERLDFILSNRGFKEVLDAFWFVLTPFINDNEALNKEGYIKLNHVLQKSLEGHDAAWVEIETDWAQNEIIYGELTKYSFFQFLYDEIGKHAYTRRNHIGI